MTKTNQTKSNQTKPRMSTDKGGDAPLGVGVKGAVDWTECVPKNVDSEDSLGIEENKRTWERMYKRAGMVSANEKERRMLRAAVYVYCLKNGTSREGEYSGNMILANGTVVSAAVIPGSSSKMKIRKFLRANMAESYQFFKESRIIENDARYVAKCAALGISPECAFATADWMADCPDFTPAESRAHDAAFVRGIERARRARGGKNLEAVESGRLDDALHAQGPAYETGGQGSVEF